MTERSEYGEWPVLQEIYLEDSYVLEIQEAPDELTFRMEFVLREGHEEYHRPKQGEQYCYRRGCLKFRRVGAIRWLERNDVRSFDATGESDLGNIDVLFREEGRFTVSGDWGRVSFVSEEIIVKLEPELPL